MICRRQGRRSAQTAEETKHQILATAGKMFCQQGFEKVSLRNISEAAGVSHSLIRHHFGSKEQIWYAVNDTLSAYMHNYIQALIEEIPDDKPANVKLYHFAVKLLAHMLLTPQPMQFIADAIRQEGEFFDYFLGQSDRFEILVLSIVEQHNNENPEHQIDLWETKWQLISSAHAAISLKPLLQTVWQDKVKSEDETLLRHWQLFEKSQFSELNIRGDDRIAPTSLKELLLPIACDFSNAENCKAELKKFS
jgi:AcrR family transcriptional regulator